MLCESISGLGQIREPCEAQTLHLWGLDSAPPQVCEGRQTEGMQARPHMHTHVHPHTMHTRAHTHTGTRMARHALLGQGPGYLQKENFLPEVEVTSDPPSSSGPLPSTLPSSLMAGPLQQTPRLLCQPSTASHKYSFCEWVGRAGAEADCPRGQLEATWGLGRPGKPGHTLGTSGLSS